MTRLEPEKIQVYAVIRIDTKLSDPEKAVTVKEILPTIEQAEAEVERLNRVNADKDCRYIWRATRYFPEGRTYRRRLQVVAD